MHRAHTGPAAPHDATTRPRCGRLAPEPGIRVHSERNRDTDPSRRKLSPTRVCREEDTWPVGGCREDARSRKASCLRDGGGADGGEILACESVGYGRGNSQCCWGSARSEERRVGKECRSRWS